MKPQRLLVAGLLAMAAIIAAVLFVVPRFSQPHVLSGYVEGEPLYPAAPISGRLVALNVQRGDVVAASAPLFSIDPAQGDAAKSQAIADAQAAKALAADARRGQRPAELAIIEANLAAARASEIEAGKQLARIQPLVEAGAAPRAQLDTAVAARDSARANVRAIEKQLQAAKLGARKDQVAAADERVRGAEADVAAADARLADLTPVAPGPGRIEDVFFQPGEWVPANQPVLSLIPDDRVRLRFFVPEKSVSAYAVGKDVAFTCDGCAAGLKATITYIAPRPEFTPPTIYAREARDRMVFLLEARIAPGSGLSPGQPVDVTPLASAK